MNHFNRYRAYTACFLGFALASVSLASQFPPKGAPQNASYFFIQNADVIHVSAGQILLTGLANQMTWAEEQTRQFVGIQNRIGPISYQDYMQVSWLGKNAPFMVDHPNGIISGYYNGKLITLTTTLTQATYFPQNNMMRYMHSKPLFVQGDKPSGSSYELQNGVVYIDSLSNNFNGA